MSSHVQVGTVIVREGVILPADLEFQSGNYSADWRIVEALDGSSFDRLIRSAGWSFFFMAQQAKAIVLGWDRGKALRSAVLRILSKVRAEKFNSVEVTEISGKRFLGVPYLAVVGHARHIQESHVLQTETERRQEQRDVEWASG
jgi:hypothetical protein